MGKMKRIQCPHCDLTFAFERKLCSHLVEDHQVTVDLFQHYLDVYHNGIHPTCQCSSECKEKLNWIGWHHGFVTKYVRGHNAVVDTCFRTKAKELAKKRSEGYRSGKNVVWNKGLSVETDERVRAARDKMKATQQKLIKEGKNFAWNINKTPEEIQAIIEKREKRKKKRFEAGEIKIWSKGLTKNDHPSLQLLSEKIKAITLANHVKRFKPDKLQEIINNCSDVFELLSPIDDYRNKYHRFELRCRKNGHIVYRTIMSLKDSPICRDCNPFTFSSKGEKEVLEYVKENHCGTVIHCDREQISPLELDVYVPDLKLGIEYNGTYFHSEKHCSFERHRKKFLACQKEGIRLFAIYEDEWNDKREIVQSMILSRIGLTTKLNARCLSIIQVSGEHVKDFFNENHIDGHARCKVAFCLIDSDCRIISALSLRKPFHKSLNNKLEVARFATLKNHQCRGALGKLTKVAVSYAIENKIDGLITYVDERVGVGESYQKVGWNCINNGSENFFWLLKNGKRVNRFQVRAQKGKSEKEVAQEIGAIKVFGYGVSKFEIKL